MVTENTKAEEQQKILGILQFNKVTAKQLSVMHYLERHPFKTCKEITAEMHKEELQTRGKSKGRVKTISYYYRPMALTLLKLKSMDLITAKEILTDHEYDNQIFLTATAKQIINILFKHA